MAAVAAQAARGLADVAGWEVRAKAEAVGWDAGTATGEERLS